MKKINLFAKPEGFFGRISCCLMNIGNQAQYKSVIDSLPKDKYSCILDIGYGNGAVLKQISKLGYRKINGIEISHTMHELAQKKFAKELSDEIVKFAKGSVEYLPFENDSMNFVYSINTIYFWESLDAGLKEIYRITKPQGCMLIAFYDRRFLQILPYTKSGFKLYENEEIANKLREYGFHIKKIISKKNNLALCYVCEVNKE